MTTPTSILLRDAARRIAYGALAGATAEVLWLAGGAFGWIRSAPWGVPFVVFACVIASNAESTPYEAVRRGRIGLLLISTAMAALFAAAIGGAVALAGGAAGKYAMAFFLISLTASLATAAVGRWRRARRKA